MAKQSKLESVVARFNSIESARLELKAMWDSKTTEQKNEWAKELGYASERSLYVAFREPPFSILPGGSCRNTDASDGEKAQRKTRAKGVLPIEVERWIRDGLLADFIFDGGDRDDWEGAGEITTEVFFGHRPVIHETKAYIKILDRIGGLESEAGRALREWAGRPLTAAQAQTEKNSKVQRQQETIDKQVFLLANDASELVRNAIFNLFADETLLDRKISGSFLNFS